jgi:uncharacterized protein (DUF1684 family)
MARDGVLISNQRGIGTADGKWVINFNKAYNSWCAYSENYTYPFVPPENWLKVPVHAGEKKSPLKKSVPCDI